MAAFEVLGKQTTPLPVQLADVIFEIFFISCNFFLILLFISPAYTTPDTSHT